jgi:hypothetical protein
MPAAMKEAPCGNQGNLVVNPPPSARTYSHILDDDPDTNGKGQLDSEGWIPKFSTAILNKGEIWTTMSFAE